MMNPISAHRGWSGKAPENTLAAFQLALLASEVSSIEFDVQLTKDGVPVVIHDFTLERTTNGKGFVKDKTYQQLRQLDAGSWFSPEFRGEKIPTLEEVFQLVKGRKRLYLELKQAGLLYPGMEEKVANLIKEYDMYKEVTVISFDHESVKEIKDWDPRIQTGLIIYGRPVLLIEQLKYTGASCVGLGYPYLTPDILKELISHNFKIMLGPGDDKSAIETILRFHPKIEISTNHPDLVIELQKN